MAENKKRMNAWIWVLIIVVLIAAGIGIYFWLSKGSSTASMGAITQPPALPTG